jgi:hypothetical protein
MKRFAYGVLAFGALLAFTSATGIAQELKLFPGAQLDDKASSAASKTVPGKESKVYTTSESFEKVFAFYKGVYKQDTSMPATGPKLPSGQQIQWAFFIIDGGTKLSNSNNWMKIQHPYVGGTDGKDIREVTVIQCVRKK